MNSSGRTASANYWGQYCCEQRKGTDRQRRSIWCMCHQRLANPNEATSGAEGQNTVKRSFQHVKVTETIFGELLEQINDLFAEAKNVTVNRVILFSRKHEEGESLEQSIPCSRMWIRNTRSTTSPWFICKERECTRATKRDLHRADNTRKSAQTSNCMGALSFKPETVSKIHNGQRRPRTECYRSDRRLNNGGRKLKSEKQSRQ